MTSLLDLPADEAHVWFVREDEVRAPELLASYLALLSPDERARHARYVLERSRHQYLLTRALVRTVLSRYASVAPQDWRFLAGPFGRPMIAGPDRSLQLRFNLSNTAGLVVCLVARDGLLGVDVENTERIGATVELADRFFSPSESTALHAQPPGNQRRRFFELWTLKEAYIKARGLGLQIPLAWFSFVLSPPDPVRLELDPRLRDDPRQWHFHQYEPTPRHLMAVALRPTGGSAKSVVVRETVP
jgi:4'-phosphopantetheinyl transferase